MITNSTPPVVEVQGNEVLIYFKGAYSKLLCASRDGAEKAKDIFQSKLHAFKELRGRDMEHQDFLPFLSGDQKFYDELFAAWRLNSKA